MNINTITAIADALAYFSAEWAATSNHPASIFADHVSDLSEALADLTRQGNEGGARPPDAPDFVAQFNAMQAAVHLTALDKGWWDRPREQGTTLMNIVGELAEAFDALAHGDPADKHLPKYRAVVVELADAVIRIMDFAAFYDWDIAAALVAKAEYNKGREYRHGKEF